MEIILEQAWRDGAARGVLRVAIGTTVPLKTLKACPWVRPRLRGENLSWTSGPGGAAQLLQTAVRTIRFIEATGARPSKARGLFTHPWADNRPVGLDHTLVWRDRDGVLFMTAEVYAPPPEGAWDSYAYVGLPKGVGMWNPPATTLFLLAKPEHLANLARLRDDLLAFRMPTEPAVQVETAGTSPTGGTSNTHADIALQ